MAALLPRLSIAPAPIGFFRNIKSLLFPALAVPASFHLNIPTLLPGILESILRAVPKKKQSHSRKRMRQLAGKALKDVTALNRCSACGKVKRSHLLCEHCVQEIKDMWLGKSKDVV
ncbi:hypothetical protein EDC01DRAFT_615785 [Geopyxis carbonaria]|nr:hypothetical protein EDC01DRAFT_615785 [Geopyxis carbonaria]